MTNLNTDTTSQTITAQRGHSQALAFSRHGGEGLSNVLANIARAKAAEREGPLHTFLFLLQNYSEDEQHSIPRPGSKKDDAGNKPYDKYTSQVHTKEGLKNVPGSWFTDVVKSTAAWAEVNQRILWCGGETEGMPEDVSRMSDGEREEEIKNLRRFISDMRTGLVNGARLFLQAEEISKLNPARIKVKMPFKKMFKLDGNGERIKIDGTNEYVTEMRVVGSIIRVIDPIEDGDKIGDKVFTVSEFLALDPTKMEAEKDKAKWTIALLEKTKNRGTKVTPAGDTGEAGKVKVTDNIETLLTYFNVINASLDEMTEAGQKVRAKITAAMAIKGEKGQDVIESVGDACMVMDAIWTQIEKPYLAIKAAKAAKNNPAKAA